MASDQDYMNNKQGSKVEVKVVFKTDNKVRACHPQRFNRTRNIKYITNAVTEGYKLSDEQRG